MRPFTLRKSTCIIYRGKVRYNFIQFRTRLFLFQAFVATSLGTVGGFNRFKFRHRQGGDKKEATLLHPPLASSPLRDTPEADAVMGDALNRARKGRKGKRRRRKRKKTVPRKVTPKEQRTKSQPERCAYFFAKRDEKSFSFLPIRFFLQERRFEEEDLRRPIRLAPERGRDKGGGGAERRSGKDGKDTNSGACACFYFHSLICSLLSGNTESLENKGGEGGGGRRNKRGQPQHCLPTKDLESPLRNH